MEFYSRFTYITTTFLDLYSEFKQGKPKANDFDITKLRNDKLSRENKDLAKTWSNAQKKNRLMLYEENSWRSRGLSYTDYFTVKSGPNKFIICIEVKVIVSPFPLVRI